MDSGFSKFGNGGGFFWSAGATGRHGNAPDSHWFGKTGELFLAGHGGLPDFAEKILRFGTAKNLIRDDQFIAGTTPDEPRRQIHDGTKKIQLVIGVHRETWADVEG